MAAPWRPACRTAVRQIRSSRAPCASQWRSASSTSTSLRHRQSDLDNDPKHNPFDAAPQEPAYETDDLSSLAHGELQVHREIRQLLRTAAWEMPLLSELAKSHPFVPASPETHPLRWRYTTYMGENHPAANKVMVEFAVRHLPLDEAQQQTFIKLAGTRWNPETGIVKMSHEAFPSQAQNKRYLGDTIQSLVAEARDADADAFADIPIDTRHHKSTKRAKFPDEWRMTPERQAELEGRRRETLLEEGRRVEESRIVSGVAAIEYARQIAAQQAQTAALEQPERVEQRVAVGRRARR